MPRLSDVDGADMANAEALLGFQRHVDHSLSPQPAHHNESYSAAALLQAWLLSGMVTSDRSLRQAIKRSLPIALPSQVAEETCGN
mgnify:CR=1 FL=1